MNRPLSPSPTMETPIDVNCLHCPYPEYAARLNGGNYPAAIKDIVWRCTDLPSPVEQGERLCPVAALAIGKLVAGGENAS